MLSEQPAFTTPLEWFYHWEKTTPDACFLRQPIDGNWRQWTYRETGNEVRRIAAALKNLKLPPASHIAILSKNCAHWIIADLAIWMAGHVSVPIYPTLSADGLKYILDHSECKAIFLGKLDAFEKQRHVISPDLFQFSFPFYGPEQGTPWIDLLTAAPITTDQRPQAEDIASLMYSSGTTGNPKGVMLSFGAFDFVGKGLVREFKITQPQSLLSYLPLSHIAEKAYAVMTVLYCGGSLSFTESLEKFPANLQHVQPHVFGGVPRIFTKFQEGVLSRIPQKKLSLLLRIPLISTIVKKAILKKLGFSRTHLAVGGAAPIPPSVLHWFSALGINIFECYGLTENCGYSHGDHGAQPRFGTVGRPWSGVETKFGDDGEILVRHPGLMKGYFKDTDATSKTFTHDGYLKTGDKGAVDADGYLTITGRIKDQFKTDKAKFVAPAPIENLLLVNKDIEQVCVVGTGIPQPIALVVLSASGKAKSTDELKKSIGETFEIINPTLGTHERLAKAVVIKDDWTIENGLLTPSLKLKRYEIEKLFSTKYLHWYHSSSDSVVNEELD